MLDSHGILYRKEGIMARKVTVVLSHWYTLIEGLQESSQEFYTGVESALGSREIGDLDISRIDYKEGAIFSSSREYLRVRRKEYLFDICAAPYGNGFFVSWWMGESPGTLWNMVLVIPILGPLLLNMLRPITYYQQDTYLMFQESVRKAVLEVVDSITEAKGLRALSDTERKPVMGDATSK